MAKSPRETPDLNVTAFNTLNQFLAKNEPKPVAPEKNPAAVSLGRLGGLKGGKARAKSLTPRQRADIAKKAAKARWKSDKNK